MAKTSKSDEVQPIIIKKVKKGGGGHHGGAWKVAYADFVTAMMAFFLLLWLLNVSTDEARQTISNYFDPSHPKISDPSSGAGGLMGGTAVSTEGAMTSTVTPLTAPQTTGMSGQKDDEAELEKLEEQLREQEEKKFEEAKKELEESLQKSQELKELAKNLIIDVTPEGLRIQLVDQQGKPLFPIGSAEMYDYTKNLVKVVSDVIRKLPNDISVRGHTDSYKYAPGAKYTNWELSSDRANSSRRELMRNNINPEKLKNVMGKADTEHLVPENPLDPKNRRITIMLLRETVEEAMQRGAFGTVRSVIRPKPAEQKPYTKTQGEVYFP